MLGAKVASGAAWLVGARLGTKLLDLISTLVLARLLVPADFGLVALAVTVLVILNSVTDMSLGTAVVQIPKPTAHHYDTVFTLTLLRGLAIFLLMAVIAVPFADFYQDDRLVWPIVLLGLAPLIRGMISPKMIVYVREVRFLPQFVLEVGGKVAAFLVTLLMAYLHPSYWAMVAGLIAAPVITTFASYILAPYRPKLDLSEFKGLIGFTGWITLSQVVGTLNLQADRLILGNYLGKSVLGQYVVGSELAGMPTQVPLAPIMQALYAGFAKLKGDLAMLQSAYRTSQTILVAIALPLGLVVGVLAEKIVLLALGPTWLPAASVITVLAPVIALQIVTGPAQSAMMALGLTRTIFNRDLLGLCIRIPTIVLGLYLAGLEGVIWARALTGGMLIYLNLQVVSRHLNISMGSQLLAPWRSLVSGVALTAVVLGLEDQIAAPEQFLLSACGVAAVATAGIAAYIGCHLILWQLSGRPQGAETKLFSLAAGKLGRIRAS